MLGRHSYRGLASKYLDRFSTNLLPLLGGEHAPTSDASGEAFHPHLFTAFQFDRLSQETVNESMRRRMNSILRRFAADHELVELQHYSDSNAHSPKHAFFARLKKAAPVHVDSPGYALQT